MGWGGSGSVALRLFYGCSTRPDSCLDQICELQVVGQDIPAAAGLRVVMAQG